MCALFKLKQRYKDTNTNADTDTATNADTATATATAIDKRYSVLHCAAVMSERRFIYYNSIPAGCHQCMLPVPTSHPPPTPPAATDCLPRSSQWLHSFNAFYFEPAHPSYCAARCRIVLANEGMSPLAALHNSSQLP